MKNRVKNGVAFVRHFGIQRFMIELYYRTTEFYYERWLDVNTKGMIGKGDLGINSPDSVDYVPMGYTAIYSILKKVPVDRSSSTFLDYGAGKGRAVIVAATFPFKKCIGIEISEQLVEIAKRNIDRMRHRKARFVELNQVDATEFNVGPSVNVIYFFNPFRGSTLRKVVMNIYSSYRRNPRKLYIVFFNDEHFEKIIRDQDWLRKTYQRRFYPEYSCGIYETV